MQKYTIAENQIFSFLDFEQTIENMKIQVLLLFLFLLLSFLSLLLLSLLRLLFPLLPVNIPTLKPGFYIKVLLKQIFIFNIFS